MPREDAIIVEGVVVEAVRPALFRVELANGHRVLSHPARRDRDAVADLTAGDRVILELSPFDMSNGRIVVQRTKD